MNRIYFSLLFAIIIGISACGHDETIIGHRVEEYPTFPSDAKIVLSTSFSDFKDSIYHALDILGFENAEINEKDSLESVFFSSFKDGWGKSLESKLKKQFGRDYHISITIINKFDKNSLEAIYPMADFIKKNFDYYLREYRYRTTVITEVGVEVTGRGPFSFFKKEYIFRMKPKGGEFETQWNLFKAHDLSVK